MVGVERGEPRADWFFKEFLGEREREFFLY